jgi:flagellar M-ring protein FliF
MNGITAVWSRLGRGARGGLAAGTALVVLGSFGLGWYLMRTPYEVLFSGLERRDSAAMVADLEKDKIAYELQEDGSTILVPADQVHKTRLKLAAREAPLMGGVGFELINNNEVGMTDFAQKVNYQRALQGELTRTIVALDEVRSARVHLALPEQGLFRRAGAQQRAKASVTLTLKPERVLSREQVRGVQRLVAAAVPEIKPEDVTVLDQRGVALTSETMGPEGGGAVSAGIEGKREVEEYLSRKVRDVLDQTFGAGQSIARIDVVLNQDQTRVTTESVLPSNSSDGHPAGVLVRQMETGAGNAGRTTSVAGGESGEIRTRDVQYQVGRRVEQVVTGPGSVARINIAVVVKRALDTKQVDRVKELVATSAGLNRLRGDAITVFSIDQVAPAIAPAASAPAPSTAAPAPAVDALAPEEPVRQPIASRMTDRNAAVDATLRQSVLVSGVLLVLLGVAFAWARRRRAAQAPAEPKALPVAQRERLLVDVQRWLDAKPQAHH